MMEKKVARHFLEEVKIFIPQEHEQEILFDALRNYQKSLDLPTLMSDLKVVINEPDRILLYEEIRPLIPLKQQMEYDSLCPVLPSETLKVIRLRRYGNESLGFAVRGGLEHGVGIFVSHVSQQSQAYQQGLRSGDEIVRVNGFTINEAIHEEVLSLIKARNEIVLKIRRIGMLPVKNQPNDNLRWEYVQKQSIYSKANGSPNSIGKTVKIFINMSGAAGLGCRIASGPPSNPGIFIQFVKEGGLAEEAGLEVGDQIIQVNDTSFLNVSHSQAVVALKGSKHLEVTIRKGISSLQRDSAPQNDSVPLSLLTSLTDSNMSTNSYPESVNQKADEFVSNQAERSLVQTTAPNIQAEQPTQANGHLVDTHQAAETLHTPETCQEETSRLELEKSMLTLLRKAQQEELYEQMKRAEEKSAAENEWKVKLQGFQQDKAEIMREAILKSPNTNGEDQPSNFILKKQPAPLAPHAVVQAAPNTHSVPGSNKQKNRYGSLSEDLTDMEARRLFSAEQISRRQIRLIKLRMNGPLGIELEGGLDSPLNGRINVAAIMEGAAARQGGIHVGDQLMMADNIKLIDVPLIQAENVLDLAEKKTGELIKFIVAVAPPKYYEEEATYF